MSTGALTAELGSTGSESYFYVDGTANTSPAISAAASASSCIAGTTCDRGAAAASPAQCAVLRVAAANGAALRLRGTLRLSVADAWYGET